MLPPLCAKRAPLVDSPVWIERLAANALSAVTSQTRVMCRALIAQLASIKMPRA
jgi:hypothetical protein